MYFLFMFIIIPSVLIYAGLRAVNKLFNLYVLVGGLCGVFVTAAVAIFSYQHYIPEYNFGTNLVYYLLHFYALPMIILYLVFYFCTKDEAVLRVKAFFPLVAPFYAVYMPYIIISSGTNAYSFFLVFIKPVLVLSMIFYASRFVFNIYDGFVSKEIAKIIVNFLLLFAAIAIPAVLETMWLLHILDVVTYAISVLYGAGALALFFVESREGEKYFF